MDGPVRPQIPLARLSKSSPPLIVPGWLQKRQHNLIQHQNQGASVKTVGRAGADQMATFLTLVELLAAGRGDDAWPERL